MAWEKLNIEVILLEKEKPSTPFPEMWVDSALHCA